MEYKKIGKTDMDASIVGLGTEHLDGKPYEIIEKTIDTAVDRGINILDLFMPGEEIRRNIGKALGRNRHKMIIQGHICSVDLNEQYDISRDLEICKKYFENLLKFLNTDYIDFGMFFFMDSEEAFDKVFHGGIGDYMFKLKEQGTIRAIGASSHNPIIAKQIVETGLVDSLMFSINPAFDMTPAKEHVLETLDEKFSEQKFVGIDSSRAELYKCCQQREIGITVMKTLGSGKLLSSDYTPFHAPMTVAQCIHYALSRPSVVSALVGCDSPEQVIEAVSYIDLPDEEKDYTDIISSYKSDFEGSCVYCSHCQPCPVNIDIATVNKYLDIALLDKENIPPSIKQHYKSLNACGSQCIACGNCEKRCPFGVPIIENMNTAANLFEKK